MTTALPFRKMNGLGNEIVVVDLRGTSRVLSAGEARAIARRPGSHFDQMMVLHDPKTAGTEAYVRIYNTDGSAAEACGNGMRCVGWTVAQQIARTALNFETVAGVLDVQVEGIDRITVDMGKPRFGWQDIPLAEPFHDTRGDRAADRADRQAAAAFAVGGQHRQPARRVLGRRRERVRPRPLRPDAGEPSDLSRARQHLAGQGHLADGAITLRTWERGAGLTRACGSAACAATVCAARKGLTGRKVMVTLPGGDLEIEWRADDRIFMTGPVEVEHDGVLEALEPV